MTIVPAVPVAFMDFYSHASCEAWPFTETTVSNYYNFYSHASCEAWRTNRPVTFCQIGFLLTCLLRGMTMFWCPINRTLKISTHMPLARHDLKPLIQTTHTRDFYSHASCEAWHASKRYFDMVYNFYSHASCEAWRSLILFAYQWRDFYSHASCEAWL